ncbi:DOMON domain-containing protein [Trichostrongylus colubriformis]|uniref:DOMON domain-containing protein n=1 Tax=Trichostrongylus colubriformis TaxID=6319 RepID=A0AAN8J3D1_TRICO
MAPKAMSLLLFIAIHFISNVVADPCIFREENQQLIYGIRDGVVHFRVILRGVPQSASGWTGIGFGRGMIEGLDTIVVRLANGQVRVTDEYVRGYAASTPDMINNVVVHSSRWEGDTVSVTFSRPVNSDEYPYDSSLLGCQPWQFVIGLNRMGPNGEMRHHRVTPVPRIVCIDQCRI